MMYASKSFSNQKLNFADICVFIFYLSLCFIFHFKKMLGHHFQTKNYFLIAYILSFKASNFDSEGRHSRLWGQYLRLQGQYNELHGQYFSSMSSTFAPQAEYYSEFNLAWLVPTCFHVCFYQKKKVLTIILINPSQQYCMLCC